jgi:hypothetical protein
MQAVLATVVPVLCVHLLSTGIAHSGESAESSAEAPATVAQTEATVPSALDPATDAVVQIAHKILNQVGERPAKVPEWLWRSIPLGYRHGHLRRWIPELSQVVTGAPESRIQGEVKSALHWWHFRRAPDWERFFLRLEVVANFARDTELTAAEIDLATKTARLKELRSERIRGGDVAREMIEQAEEARSAANKIVTAKVSVAEASARKALDDRLRGLTWIPVAGAKSLARGKPRQRRRSVRFDGLRRRN